MAENTISPELLDRINQFAGAGAVSDQEMMMMQDNQQRKEKFQKNLGGARPHDGCL